MKRIIFTLLFLLTSCISPNQVSEEELLELSKKRGFEFVSDSIDIGGIKSVAIQKKNNMYWTPRSEISEESLDSIRLLKQR